MNSHNISHNYRIHLVSLFSLLLTMETKKRLSVLVPTLLEREQQFNVLFAELTKQAKNKPVEILFNSDNKQKSTGQKRNELLSRATGAYIVFVDDDDKITNDYVDSLLEAIEQYGTDVINFKVYYWSRSYEMDVLYSIRYERDASEKLQASNGRFYTERLPNHLMAVKRSLAIQAGFPDLTHREDSEYAKRLKPLLTSEHQIPKTLYHYLDTKR